MFKNIKHKKYITINGTKYRIVESKNEQVCSLCDCNSKYSMTKHKTFPHPNCINTVCSSLPNNNGYYDCIYLIGICNYLKEVKHRNK